MIALLLAALTVVGSLIDDVLSLCALVTPPTPEVRPTPVCIVVIDPMAVSVSGLMGVS